MKVKVMVLAVAVCAAAVWGADLTTTKGQVYKNYDVDRATPYGLSIFHDGGTVTVPYTELPEEIRAKYKENEESSLQDIQRIEKGKKQADKEKQQNEYLVSKMVTLPAVRVRQIVPYATKDGKTQYGVLAIKSVVASYEDGIVCVIGLDTKKLKRDALIFNDSEEKIVYHGSSITGSYSASALAGGGPSKEVVKNFKCWEIGTYHFTNELGGVTGVPKYTANKKLALEHFEKGMAN